MNKWIILFILFVLSCGKTKEAKTVIFDTYDSYSLRDDVEYEDEIFYLVSPKYADFNHYFTQTATMSRKKWIDQNGLGNQLIIAIANSADDTTQSVSIESIKKQGSILLVDYSLNKLDNPSGSLSRHTTVAVAAARDIKKVIFYETDEERKTIYLK